MEVNKSKRAPINVNNQQHEDIDEAMQYETKRKLKYHPLKRDIKQNGSRNDSHSVSRQRSNTPTPQPSKKQISSHSRSQPKKNTPVEVKNPKPGKYVVKEKLFYNIINDKPEKKVTNFLDRRSPSIHSQRDKQDDKSVDRKQRLNDKKKLIKRSQSFNKHPPKDDKAEKVNKPGKADKIYKGDKNEKIDKSALNQNAKSKQHIRSISHQRKEESSIVQKPNNKKSQAVSFIDRNIESDYNTLIKNKSNYDTVKSKVTKRKLSKEAIRSRSVKKLVKTEVEELVFKPLLSKKSMEIASKLGNHKDRLLKYSNYSKLDEMEAEYQRLMDLRKQATPKINKKSEYIDRQKSENEEMRHEMLYKYSDKYRDKKEQLRIKKIEEEIQKEMMVSNKRPPTPNKTYKPNFYTADVDVADRNDMWKSKNEEKLKKMQTQKDQLELRDCTFAPNINRSTSTKYIKDMKDSVYSSEFLKEGLYNHFTRIEKAKREKSYQEMGKSKSRSINKKDDRNVLYDEIDNLVNDDDDIGYIKKSRISQTAPVHYINESYQSLDESGSQFSQTDKGKSLVNILENLKKINQIM